MRTLGRTLEFLAVVGIGVIVAYLWATPYSEALTSAFDQTSALISEAHDY